MPFSQILSATLNPLFPPCGKPFLKYPFPRSFWLPLPSWRNGVLFGLPHWHHCPSPRCSHSSGYTLTLAIPRKSWRCLTAFSGWCCIAGAVHYFAAVASQWSGVLGKFGRFLHCHCHCLFRHGENSRSIWRQYLESGQ